MKIPTKIRTEVLNRDGYICKLCGREIDPRIATIDHIISVADGGTNELSNLRTLCPTCNFARSKLVDAVTTPLSEHLARGWITWFTKAPVATVVVSIIAFVLGVSGFFVIYSKDRQMRETQRLENHTYTAQIARLNETEQKIKELLSFVIDQKSALKKTEDAIAALKAERETLAPLVESQQKVVDALFAAQEKRNALAVKKERWIGFGLGVGSSIVASFLWMICSYFIKQQRDS